MERQIKADRPGEADGRRSRRPEEPRLGSPAAPDHRDGTAVPAQSVVCWLGQKPPPLARPGFHSVTGNSLSFLHPLQIIPVPVSCHTDAVLS